MPSKKASQKTLQKLVLGAILSSKTLLKSKKKPSKDDAEKRLAKRRLQDPPREVVDQNAVARGAGSVAWRAPVGGVGEGTNIY